MTGQHLEMWTVYDHPTDWPDGYIARKWVILPTGPHATDECIVATGVSAIRNRFEEMGLVKLARSPEDDPSIMETWV